MRDLAEVDVPLYFFSANRPKTRTIRSRLWDLRDSGSIEEFADVVMFLYREDYYYPEKAKQEGTEGQVEVIFAKQRKGPTGSAYLQFIKEYTRFVEESPRHE